jgi:hypothetical protein
MTYCASESDERLRFRIEEYREEVAHLEAAIQHRQARCSYLRVEIALLECELDRRARTATEL